MQTPSKGRMVFVPADPAMNNGDDYAVAVVTRVWSDTRVNVRVFLDAFTMPLHRTSVELFETRPEAAPAQGDLVAWWPPRV